MIIGSEIILYEDLPSTNTYVTSLLKNEVVNEGTIVRADFQSAGKGQAGNSWESEKGKNLLISIILCPKLIQASEQFLK